VTRRFPELQKAEYNILTNVIPKEHYKNHFVYAYEKQSDREKKPSTKERKPNKYKTTSIDGKQRSIDGKRMRRKHLLYPEEQKQVKQEFIKVLELDAQNSITLYDLDYSYKREKIMNLLPKIRSYFSLSRSTAISNPDRFDRPYLTIIKQLTKDEYDMVSADWRIQKDNHIIRTRKYYFLKKTI